MNSTIPPSEEINPDIINAAQCARLLHCSEDQVEELARAGDIPGLKIGRHWLFVRSDLLCFLADCAREEAAERRAKRRPHAAPSKRRRSPPPLLP